MIIKATNFCEGDLLAESYVDIELVVFLLKNDA